MTDSLRNRRCTSASTSLATVDRAPSAPITILLRRRTGAVEVPSGNAGHGAAGIAGDTGDRDPEADIGTGRDGGVDEDRIEDGPARRVEGVDSVGGLDRDRDVSSAYRNVVRNTGGVPAATTRSSSPHLASCITPPRISAWVDTVSDP